MNKQTLTSRAILFSSCSYQVAILVASHSRQTMFHSPISDAFRSSWYAYTFMNTYFIFSFIVHANRLAKKSRENLHKIHKLSVNLEFWPRANL